MNADLADMLAANAARVNARLAAEGRCIMHNSDVRIPAEHLVELPIGNVILLCAPCFTEWLVAAKEDPSMVPLSICDYRVEA